MPFSWKLFKKTKESDEDNQNQGLLLPPLPFHAVYKGFTSASTGGSANAASGSHSSPNVQNQAEKRPSYTELLLMPLESATSGIISAATVGSTSTTSGSHSSQNVQGQAEKRSDSTPKKQSGEPSRPGETKPRPQSRPREHPSGIPCPSPPKNAPRTASPAKAPATSQPPRSAPASSRPPGKSSAREPSPGKSSATTHSQEKASADTKPPQEKAEASTKPPESSKDSKPGQSRTDAKTSEKSKPSNEKSKKGSGLPPGTVFPSGIPSTGVPIKIPPTTAVLNPNRKIDYGYGTIMPKRKKDKGPSYSGENEQLKKELQLKHPEDIKNAGNEHYKNGRFKEAMILYSRAIELLPNKPTYRSNRAAALAGLGYVLEAVRDCEIALKLDLSYSRARQRLGMLFLRLGLLENARRTLSFPKLPLIQCDVLQLISAEKHMSICSIFRQRGDWENLIIEIDATIAAGVDASPQLYLCKAEALLKLRRANELEPIMGTLPRTEGPRSSSCRPEKFFGYHPDAYTYMMKAKVEMALGWFDHAITNAEKALKAEPESSEIARLVNVAKMVARARTRGNNLFENDRYTEATYAYADGLRVEPANSVLYNNRAACWFKIRKYERAIDDCNQALYFRPKFPKALYRRGYSYCMLKKWEEAIEDFEVLQKELPDDKRVADALLNAKIALKDSRKEEEPNKEEASDTKIGGEVEIISDLYQFKAAKSLPDVSVIYFEIPSNSLCMEMTPFVVDTLCKRYPSISFYKLDIKECPKLATDVKVVPAFRIYKNGKRVKEMICPSRDVLETSVKHYNPLN